MSDTRKPYVVTIGGVEHEMLLDDVDAARYGDRAEAGKAKSKEAEKPANKARSARNK